MSPPPSPERMAKLRAISIADRQTTAVLLATIEKLRVENRILREENRELIDAALAARLPAPGPDAPAPRTVTGHVEWPPPR